jgi:hypothetical protein
MNIKTLNFNRMAKQISISHFTGREQNDLNHIRKRIAQNLQPALLFCYGNRVSCYLQRSCFLQKKRSEQSVAAYDLLMVLDNHDPLNTETAEIIAQKLVGGQVRITMTVLSMSDLVKKLEEGDFFLSLITRSALVLINRNNSLKQPGSQKGTLSTVEMYRETWIAVEQKIHQAKRCLEETKVSFKNENYVEALVNVAQSILHSSTALLRAGFGYEMEPIPIEKAIHLSQNFTSLLSGLFPGNSKEEQEIFAFLTQRETNKEALPRVLPVLTKRATELKQSVHNYLCKNHTLLKYNPGNPNPDN